MDRREYKLFNALPLRTNIVPKYITLDTAAIVNLFIKDNYELYSKNITTYKQQIWSKFFKIKKRCFKKNGYNFDYMIKTDGISCSILFVKVDADNVPIKLPYNDINVPYIGEISDIERDDIIKSTKKVVTIDPGKNDLISAMKEGSKNNPNIFFKYTQRERNHHAKKKKYKKIRAKLKTEKISNKTITELETMLLKYNSKTCGFQAFKNYLKNKIILNRLVFDHYKQTIYRKLNWNTKINISRSEDKMLNRFEEKMGSPREIIVVIGDYSDKGMKGTESSMTKKIRKLFKQRGYTTYLIDEYNTSKICHHCKGYTENLEVNPIKELLKKKLPQAQEEDKERKFRDTLMNKLIKNKKKINDVKPKPKSKIQHIKNKNREWTIIDECMNYGKYCNNKKVQKSETDQVYSLWINP